VSSRFLFVSIDRHVVLMRAPRGKIKLCRSSPGSQQKKHNQDEKKNIGVSKEGRKLRCVHF
jgi:hypothetical protein